jgi:hypothetical protein
MGRLRWTFVRSFLDPRTNAEDTYGTSSIFLGQATAIHYVTAAFITDDRLFVTRDAAFRCEARTGCLHGAELSFWTTAEDCVPRRSDALRGFKAFKIPQMLFPLLPNPFLIRLLSCFCLDQGAFQVLHFFIRNFVPP